MQLIGSKYTCNHSVAQVKFEKFSRRRIWPDKFFTAPFPPADTGLSLPGGFFEG
jgi:hypothetical protein